MPARRYVLLALAISCVVGIGFTFPLVLHPATTVIDDGTYDAYQFIWNVWWVKEALVHLHTNPFHTRLLFYPDGAGLLFHTFSASLGVASIPFQLLLPGGAVTAHNLLVIAGPTLIVFVTFLLAHEVTGDPLASVVAGLVAAINPAMAWFVPIIYLTATYLVAAVLWAWWRLHRRRRAGDVVLVLVLTAVLVFASQEYAMMALALLAMDTVCRVLPPERTGLRPAWWPGVAATWGTLALVLGALALFAIRNPAAPPNNQSLLFGSGFLRGFVTPPWLYTSPFRFWKILYLGTAPLLIVVTTLAFARRRAAFWLLALAVVLLMACGPFVGLEHPVLRETPPGSPPLSPERLAPGRVPGPYFLAYKLVPLVRFFRAAYRWVNVAHILMGVLVAIGLAGLRARLARPAARVLAAALPAVAVVGLGAFDAWGLRAPVIPVERPAVYDVLRDDPTPGAVLELPSGLISGGLANFASRYMLQQIRHRKPLLDGTVARLPPGRKLLVLLRPETFAEMPWVKWVVIHRDLAPLSLSVAQEQIARVDALLATEGALVRRDGSIEIWELRTFRPETLR